MTTAKLLSLLSLLLLPGTSARLALGSVLQALLLTFTTAPQDTCYPSFLEREVKYQEPAVRPSSPSTSAAGLPSARSRFSAAAPAAGARGESAGPPAALQAGLGEESGLHRLE